MKRQGNLIVFPDHAAALDELDALEEEAEEEEPSTPDAYEPPTSPPPAPRKRARDETEHTERPVPDTVDEVEAQVAEDLAPLSMIAIVGPDLASEVLSAVIASRIRRYNL